MAQLPVNGLVAGLFMAAFTLASTYLFLDNLSQGASITRLQGQLDTLKASTSEQMTLHSSQRALLEQAVQKVSDDLKGLRKDTSEKDLLERDARLSTVSAQEQINSEMKTTEEALRALIVKLESQIAAQEESVSQLVERTAAVEADHAEFENQTVRKLRLGVIAVEAVIRGDASPPPPPSPPSACAPTRHRSLDEALHSTPTPKMCCRSSP